MAERGLRRNNQHPLRTHRLQQAAGQRHVIHREQRRTHPFHRRDERRTRKRRTRGKSRRSLQRHNRPILRHALRAKGNDVAAARRTAEKHALPFAKPQRALSRLGGQQLFKPPSPADRAFFHAQHVAGGGICREQPPPRTGGLNRRAAQSVRVVTDQIERRRPCGRLHAADGIRRDARIQQPRQRAGARRRTGADSRKHHAKPHAPSPFPDIPNLCRRRAKQSNIRGCGGLESFSYSSVCSRFMIY